MVNPVTLEPIEPRAPNAKPDELAEDIRALPLTLPDFANNIQPYLVNKELWPRWIFTDRRRYAQARAQGWRNCTKQDLKPGYATLTPYEEEGGTKYINGDLILMLIERKRYLGALRYKHQVASALSNAAVQRTLSAKRAVTDLGDEVAAVNRQRMSQGHDPVMSVFTPGAADLNKTVLGQPGVAQKEVSRLGHEGKPDMGSGLDAKVKP
jgi:hypothetical protein